MSDVMQTAADDVVRDAAALGYRDRQMLIGQLLAMRAQIDASLLLLGVPLDDDLLASESAPDVCRHPPQRRFDLTCFDGPDSWRCLDCGHVYVAPDPDSPSSHQE